MYIDYNKYGVCQLETVILPCKQIGGTVCKQMGSAVVDLKHVQTCMLKSNITPFNWLSVI